MYITQIRGGNRVRPLRGLTARPETFRVIYRLSVYRPPAVDINLFTFNRGSERGTDVGLAARVRTVPPQCPTPLER